MKQQINVRLPKCIAEGINKQADMLDISRNSVYTMALYEYLAERGLLNVERKDRTGNIC